jgi:hypothetical protein
MGKVKLNFSRLTIPEKLSRVKQITTALTGNPNFPSPQPTLAQVTAAANDLEGAANTAQVARQQAKTATSKRDALEEVLNTMMGQLAAHVESISGDDETKILSAGMDVRDTTTPGSDPPSPPAALAMTEGDHGGELDAQWDRDARARSYITELSTNPNDPALWKQALVVTTSHATFSGLTSGQRYWCRVAAVNANGQSGWSDPATKIAP